MKTKAFAISMAILASLIFAGCNSSNQSVTDVSSDSSMLTQESNSVKIHQSSTDISSDGSKQVTPIPFSSLDLETSLAKSDSLVVEDLIEEDFWIHCPLYDPKYEEYFSSWQLPVDTIIESVSTTFVSDDCESDRNGGSFTELIYRFDSNRQAERFSEQLINYFRMVMNNQYEFSESKTSDIDNSWILRSTARASNEWIYFVILSDDVIMFSSFEYDMHLIDNDIQDLFNQLLYAFNSPRYPIDEN